MSADQEMLGTFRRHLHSPPGPFLGYCRSRGPRELHQLGGEFGRKASFCLHAIEPAPVRLLELFEELYLHFGKLLDALRRRA